MNGAWKNFLLVFLSVLLMLSINIHLVNYYNYNFNIRTSNIQPQPRNNNCVQKTTGRTSEVVGEIVPGKSSEDNINQIETTQNSRVKFLRTTEKPTAFSLSKKLTVSQTKTKKLIVVPTTKAQPTDKPSQKTTKKNRKTTTETLRSTEKLSQKITEKTRKPTTETMRSTKKLSQKITEKTRKETTETMRSKENLSQKVTEKPRQTATERPQSTKNFKKYAGLPPPTEYLPLLDVSVTEKHRRLREIHDFIYTTMDRIQSEGNCEEKKVVRCNFNVVTGFGHGMHRLAICAHTAFALNRVMIIDNHQWKHFDNLHHFTRNELGKCAYLVEKLRDTTDVCDFMDRTCYTDEYARIVDQKYKVLELTHTAKWPTDRYIPGTLPTNIRRRLTRLGVKKPYHWFTSQLLGYMLLRPNQRFQQLLNNEMKRLNWQTPCVGIHVRQTDKISGGEAKFINETEYVDKVESIFQNYYRNDKRRNIFLAADNNEVESVFQRYAQNRWQIRRYNASIAQMRVNAARHHRKDDELSTVETIVTDIHLLLKCQYHLVTFSSNIGRLIWELRSAMPPYELADNTVFSLTKGMGYSWMSYIAGPIYWVAKRDVKPWNVGKFNFIQIKRGDLLQAGERTILTLNNGTEIKCLHGSVRGKKGSGYFRMDDTLAWPDDPEYVNDMKD